MEYTIYQLEFKTGVHFGTGMLNESACTFKADQLFSALYIEALKLNLQQQFYDAVKKGNLLISDAFPYIGQQYMIPKPMIYVEPINRGESKQKKAYKRNKSIEAPCNPHNMTRARSVLLLVAASSSFIRLTADSINSE